MVDSSSQICFILYLTFCLLYFGISGTGGKVQNQWWLHTSLSPCSSSGENNCWKTSQILFSHGPQKYHFLGGFSWPVLRWGLQNKVESFIQGTEKRIFTNFHREVRTFSQICAAGFKFIELICFNFRCSVGWTSGMGWPWPISGHWRRRPRPSWTKKGIRCEEIWKY